MKPSNIIWMLAAAGAAILVFTWLLKPAGAGVTNVDAAAVEGLVGKPGVVIVDVRTAGEFEMGHIDGAINVPFNEIGSAAQSWDRTMTYVVYCATGQRSVPAVQTLAEMGFENIKHFSAGVVAWNRPLTQGAGSTGSVVQTDGRPVFLEFYTDS